MSKEGEEPGLEVLMKSSLGGSGIEQARLGYQGDEGSAARAAATFQIGE
jgi:hypothetical protein